MWSSTPPQLRARTIQTSLTTLNRSDTHGALYHTQMTIKQAQSDALGTLIVCCAQKIARLHVRRGSGMNVTAALLMVTRVEDKSLILKTGTRASTWGAETGPNFYVSAQFCDSSRKAQRGDGNKEK
jgi:hypothetical protein